MNFWSCRKCGRRDLRCSCSYSRSLVLVSLMMLVLCGCNNTGVYEKCKVVDSNGNTYSDMKRLNAGCGWASFEDKSGKRHTFEGTFHYYQD